MNTITGLLKLTMEENVSDKGYKFLIALTSDGLYITNDNKQLVETIIDGQSNDGYLLLAENENCFLDAIIMFKKTIMFGENPLVIFNIIP